MDFTVQFRSSDQKISIFPHPEVVPISHLRHSEAQRLPVSHATDRWKLADGRTVVGQKNPTGTPTAQTNDDGASAAPANRRSSSGLCMTRGFLDRRGCTLNEERKNSNEKKLKMEKMAHQFKLGTRAHTRRGKTENSFCCSCVAHLGGSHTPTTRNGVATHKRHINIFSPLQLLIAYFMLMS